MAAAKLAEAFPEVYQDTMDVDVGGTSPAGNTVPNKPTPEGKPKANREDRSRSPPRGKEAGCDSGMVGEVAPAAQHADAKQGIAAEVPPVNSEETLAVPALSEEELLARATKEYEQALSDFEQARLDSQA